VPPADLLNAGTIPDLGLINANGAALRGQKFSSKNFDFSKKAILRLRQRPSALETMDYKKIAAATAICAAIIGLTLFLGNKLLEQKQNHLAKLQSQQGKYTTLTQQDLKAQEQKISEKLKGYQSVRLNSNISYYLIKIPQFLPEGAWLNSLEMKYKGTQRVQKNNKPKAFVQSSFEMIIHGYAYHSNPNKQFDIVDTFLRKMRNSKNFAGVFKNFELTTQQSALGKYSVKSFTIKAE